MASCLLIPLLIFSQSIGQAASAPSAQIEIPSGTPLWVKTDHAIPLRIGSSVEARLMYPVYVGNRLVLPAGILVRGSILNLTREKEKRVQARFRADFTPFSRPVVQFQELVLPNQTRVALPVDPAVDGAPVLQLLPPPARKGGFVRQQFDDVVAMAKDRLALVTAPGKADRLKQLLYSQLPYHPQRVEAGTVWTFNTLSPVELSNDAVNASKPVLRPVLPMRDKSVAATWTLHAYLAKTISSAHAQVGQDVDAVVVEPVLDSTGAVAVPQGAVLKGEITRARAARRFGHAGELRFDFRELTFPGIPEPQQQVQTTLAGVDAGRGSNLSLDREGKLQPKPKDKVVVPFILLTLAGRPLDRDRGDSAFSKDAVASNSLGVLGFIIRTAGGWRNVAAGIGYYGSALAIWNRWIKRGEETVLRRNTRIVVLATPRNSAPLRTPGSASPEPMDQQSKDTSRR